MKLIGLTGSIASGKSTVCHILAKNKVPVIDADVLAKQVVAKGTEGLKKIVEQFGPDFLDSHGELDRKLLAELVFKDDDAKNKLESIVHPLIAHQTRKQLEVLEQQGVLAAVYVAPLLIEKQIQGMCDAVILIALPEHLKLQRLMVRDHLTQPQAEARLKAQWTDEQKKPYATYTIDNSQTVESTASQLVNVWYKLTQQRIMP